MSWRRFIVLVNGFGPNTATVAHLSARAGKRGGRRAGRAPDIVIDTNRNPQKFDDLLFAMAGGKQPKDT